MKDEINGKIHSYMNNKYLRQEITKKYRLSSFVKYLFTAIMLSVSIIIGLYYRQVMYVAAVLWALFLFFIPTEYSIMALIYLMSFENVFRLTASSGSLFTYFQIIPIIKIILIDKAFSVERKCLIPCILLIVYICIFAFNGLVTLFRISFGLMMLICIFQNDTGKRIECKQLIVFYSIGIVMSAIFAMTNSKVVAPYVKDVIVRLSDGTAIDRFSGLYNNANFFSIEVSLALAGNFVLFMSKDEKWYELLIIGVLLCWLGISSQSKSFVLSLVFMFIFVICFYGRHKPIYLLGFLFVVIGIVLCFRTEVQGFFEKYFYRFISLQEDNSSIDDLTTGRVEIWKKYLQTFASDYRVLFFGRGIENRITNYDPHNMYIEFIYCLGIFGTILYGIAIWGIQCKITRQRSVFLILSVLLIRGFAANIAFYINIYHYFLLIFAIKGSDVSADEIETDKIGAIQDYSRCKYLRNVSYVK